MPDESMPSEATPNESLPDGAGNPQSGNQPPAATPTPGPTTVPGPTIRIGEEFGTAKKTLPPAATIIAAIVAVILAGIVFAFFQQAKPRATGSIVSVNTAQASSDQLVIAAIKIHLRNTSTKRLWVKSIRADLQTTSGEQSADAIAAADFPRFFTAFPQLNKDVEQPLSPEDTFQPGESATRTVLVAFHVSSAGFDQRKALSVVILPYDEHVEIVLK